MKKLIPFLFFFLLLTEPPIANALFGIGAKAVTRIARISKNTKSLPDDEIVKLSKLSDEIHGTKKVGKQLGKLNLPKEALEDSYMRIAVNQGKISRKEAEEMFSRLSGTPGFRGALSKVIGNSTKKTIGHLNELKIANHASQNGFKVLGIGEKFSDGLKKAPTDIDIILKQANKTFAIEAKDYSSLSRFPVDKYRADLDTLVQFKNKHSDDVISIFSITNKPNSSRYLKTLQHEADKRGIELIFGSPREQVQKMKLLGQIL